MQQSTVNARATLGGEKKCATIVTRAHLPSVESSSSHLEAKDDGLGLMSSMSVLKLAGAVAGSVAILFRQVLIFFFRQLDIFSTHVF